MSSTKAPAPPTDVKGLVHPNASLLGTHTITIGQKAIIQPRARLNSAHGPINIGAHTIVAEKASVGYSSSPASSREKPANIGKGVIIETAATIEATSIGDHTIIEARATVGKDAVIGRNCKICAGVKLRDGENVEEGTIIWGDSWDQRRVEHDGKGLRAGAGRKGLVEGLGDGLRAVWTTK